MTRVSKARRAATLVLQDVRRTNIHARELLRTSERLRGLDDRDRALAVRLVLGITAAQGMLDKTIAAHVRKGIHLEPKVRDALRIGAFELLFLSTPASAAVSQSVELARLASARSAGMANAVLRRIANEDVPQRSAACARVAKGREREGDLELVSGYPAWLLRRIACDRGANAARSLALCATEPAPVYVAANDARLSADEVCDVLEAAGLDPVPTDLHGVYELTNPAGLTTSGLVQEAHVVVSDLSAQRIASSVISRQTSRVLEVGQGRATKTICMCNVAQRVGANVNVVGVDADGRKVEVAQKRVKRAGIAESVRCVQLDARELNKEESRDLVPGEFDVVFVDAPCTGTGTMRRHPEIPWRLTPNEVDELARLQSDILAAAATRVSAGGLLAYSTCSLLRQEDEKIVEDFLASDAGMSFGLVGEPFLSMPAIGGPDGHFCARMARIR